MFHVPPFDPCEIVECVPQTAQTPVISIFALVAVSVVMILYIALALTPLFIVLLSDTPVKQDGMINRFS